MVVRFLVLQLLLVGQLHCKGVGEIKFLQYYDTSDCGDVTGCDFYFKPLTIKDEDGHVLHNIAETASTINTDIVNLTKVKELKDPISITVPTNKTVTIVTTVWDIDDINPDDKIRDITDFIVPFDKVSVGQDWQQATKTIGREAQFAVSYKLIQCNANFTGLGCNFCERHHYTEQCNVYCVPVPGEYTCDQDTGEKICKEGKTGDNCDECKNGRVGQDCDQCKGNFVGDDCDECAQNYYPEGTCDLQCVPDEEKYTCNQQGEKQCRSNRAGEDCEGCKPNYHKDDCSKFCKYNKYYNCNEDGERVCHNATAKPEEYCGRPEVDEKKDREEAQNGVPDDYDQCKGYNITLPVAWSLAGVFFLTTVLITMFAARKFLKRKCTSTNVESEHEYIDNVITQPREKSSAGMCDETLYNNRELYEL